MQNTMKKTKRFCIKKVKHIVKKKDIGKKENYDVKELGHIIKKIK